MQMVSALALDFAVITSDFERMLQISIISFVHAKKGGVTYVFCSVCVRSKAKECILVGI